MTKKHKKRKLDKRSDIVGKTFNGIKCLKVLDKIKWKAKVFLFKCHCGVEFEDCGYQIKNGKIISCGCLREAAKFKPGPRVKIKSQERTFKWKFSDYKRGAKGRGIVFNISFEQFCNIGIKKCFYCGSGPRIVRQYKTKKGPGTEGLFTGIDRVNNQKGYDIDNIVPSCKTCNMMKKTLTFEKFISHCKKITNNLGS